MKFRVNRQELVEAMGVVGMVAAARTPKEILRGVLMRAAADHVELVATDLEIGLRYAVTQVEVESEGEVLVAAEKLGAIVRELADEVLEVEADDSLCHVRGADSHFQISAQDAKEFPAVTAEVGEPDFEIAAGVLRRLTERTVFAAARENTRYAINGVLWEKSGGALSLVATDGRRLAHARSKLISGQEGEVSAIVPSKAMALFQRILSDRDEAVAVRITGNQMLVRCPQVTVSTALVEGHFPKYQDVIPGDSNKTAEFEVAEILSAVRQAALLTNEEARGVRFSFSEGELSLSSRAPQEGEARITKPIRYKGEELEIGFNPSFLTDVFRVVHSDEVTLELKEPNRPGVLKAGDEFLYVIMPVNLS
ncbi:MAG: DNA polymerase III subunit beta [Planctomycetota bacterium]|jgi:DNA polymerase-3 subunit beta